ncbi:MAG TPA: lysine--tRNA ligase [Spirochaetota bacterium]|nr:lysine--tRNA ligase [Spirochaetota bacterium]HNT09282.1 lysine--tRNA ligase [Spirochaetota bacterium]
MNAETSDLIAQRIEKVNALRQKGINPYPVRFARTALAREIKDTFVDGEERVVAIGGRIRTRRLMGKASFANIEDLSGSIQIYAKRDDLGEEAYERYTGLDLGDIIGVEGKTFRTKTGEISVHVTSCALLAKCINPLPVVKEKDGVLFDEFADKELRYRQRYVDLIVTPKSRQDFILRSRIIAGIRSYLAERGFLEVETPMMQAIPGGAAARPFITHHNALDIDLYLRIAPELYLKRLIVGGFEKVFELNRNFRNEGISTKHNPEFTMMELYQAYADYHDMMAITEGMISTLAQDLLGAMRIDYQGSTVDLTPPWERITFVNIIKKYTGIDFETITTVEAARAAAESVGLHPDTDLSIWKIANEIFEERVEDKLIQPVFVMDYPKELSPLAKSREDNPALVERFEPYIVGREIGNAFSELNDPFDQRARFEEQVRMREAGDDEAQMMDTDYINALEYGMPPAGGLGIGIDRLVMLFVNTASIKDTILFPLLRPE